MAVRRKRLARPAAAPDFGIKSAKPRPRPKLDKLYASARHCHTYSPRDICNLDQGKRK